MELPKYHETFIPILEILNSTEALSSRDLANRIRDKYYTHLPQDLLATKTSTGANVLTDRILWGKSYLKMAKFVSYPKEVLFKLQLKENKF